MYPAWTLVYVGILFMPGSFRKDTSNYVGAVLVYSRVFVTLLRSAEN